MTRLRALGADTSAEVGIAYSPQSRDPVAAASNLPALRPHGCPVGADPIQRAKHYSDTSGRGVHLAPREGSSVRQAQSRPLA